MVLEINVNKKDSWIDDFSKKAAKEIGSFFGVNWVRNVPQVFILTDREAIDLMRGKKTEDWLTGWSSHREVYILSEENFEKESSHKYSKESYAALIKHEFTHSFLSFRFGRPWPLWLNEGLCVYLSGQWEDKKKPEIFSQFLDYFESGGKHMYSESGYAVKFLVEEYGREKLIELFGGSQGLNRDGFEKIFLEIYGFELKYGNFR